MQKVSDKKNAQAGYDACCGGVTESSSCCNSAVVDRAEVSNSGLGDLCCNTAVASGGVTGAKSETGINIETLKLGASDVASMPLSGCGCGPSLDAPAIGDYSQRKASINLLDISPRNRVADERVNHHDGLIAENEFGAHEEQPGDSCCGGSKGSAAQEILLTVKKDLNQVQRNQEVGDCCKSDSALGSVGLNVRHASSVAGNSASVLQEGK